jgi:DNA-binding transcriptional regulator YhcF (GntR family)
VVDSAPCSQEDVVDIKVLDTSHGPVYEQIRNQIEELITSGMLVSGFELPRPAALATQCSVDKGEVQRAYFELEQAGLVNARRSKNFLGEAVTTFTVA